MLTNDSTIKRQLAHALEEIAKGNFSMVNSLISSEKLVLNENIALHIICKCNQRLSKKDLENTNTDDLNDLLTQCLPYFKNIQEDSFYNYLSYVYFVWQFLLQEKNFELVLKMGKTIFPSSSCDTIDPKTASLYKSLGPLVHNAFLSCPITQENHSDFYGLCKLSVFIKMKQNENINVVVPKIVAYLNMANFIQGNIDSQYECCLKILKMVASNYTNNQWQEINEAIIKITQVVIQKFLQQKHLSKARDFITSARKKITIKCSTKLSSSCQTILDALANFMSNLETPEELVSYLETITCCSKHLSLILKQKTAVQASVHDLCHFLYIVILGFVDCHLGACLEGVDGDEFVSGLNKLLLINSRVILKIEGRTSPVCSHCSIGSDLHLSMLCLYLSGRLLEVFLTKEVPFSDRTFGLVLDSLKNGCKHVESLKTRPCPEWKTLWGRMAVTIYNVGVLMYKLKMDNSCSVFMVLIDYVFQLEGAKSEVLAIKVLECSLNCIVETSLRRCDLDNALFYAALGAYLRLNIFKSWVKSKMACKNNDSNLEKLTVICILEKNMEKINTKYPDLGINFENAQLTHVLLTELSHYKKLWPSRLSVMWIFKKLLTTTADLFTFVRAALDMFRASSDYMHQDLHAVFEEAINTYEQGDEETGGYEEQTNKKLHLAFLHGLHYLAQLLNIWLDSQTKPKQIEGASHEPTTSNGECDLATLSSSLAMDNHLKSAHAVDRALLLFGSVVATPVTVSLRGMLVETGVLEFVVKLASECRLRCDSLHEMQAWLVCLRFSRILEDKVYLMKSIAYLIEDANVASKMVGDLLKEGEHLERELAKDLSPENREVLTMFYISKSFVLLKQDNSRNGLQEYQKALDYFTPIEKVEKYTGLKIQLDFLYWHYMQLPCNLEIPGHVVYSQAKHLTILQDIIENMAQESNQFTLSLFFQISQAIVDMYRWMNLPRNARCYSKTALSYASRIVNPFRTAHFLTNLAHTDLQTRRLDDWQTKLAELADILCLETDCGKSQEAKILSLNRGDDFSFGLQLISHSSSSLGSPDLCVQTCKLPKFLRHPEACDCLYCVSVEYRVLILQYLHLQAQLYVVQQKKQEADDCFNVGLRLYEKFTADGLFREKILKRLSCDLKDSLQYTLCESYCALLLDYINCLIRDKNLAEASRFNKILVSLITERQYQKVDLYNEAIFQKIIIMSLELETQRVEEKENYLKVDSDTVAFTNMLKTPENKQSKVVFPKSFSPSPDLPPKLKFKIKKCDFASEKSPQNIPTPAPVVNGGKSPTNFVGNTENVEIAASTSAVDPTEILPQISINDSSGIIPGSPLETIAPKLFDVHKKTKVLTNKIKKSQRKQVANEKDTPGCSGAVGKNLLSEMCAVAEGTGEKQATKKKGEKHLKNAPVRKTLRKVQK